MIQNRLTPRRPSGRPSSAASFSLETLEGRRLLCGHGFGGGGRSLGAIEFDQAPAVVQSGLNSLATADSLSAPAATQSVFLGNTNGVETYSIVISGTGTQSRLTVDVAGNPVTAPTRTTTTFDAVGNAAVTDEFTAIATALGATAPVSTDSVTVVTPSGGGTVVYSMRLVTTSSSGHTHGALVSVDANGNPTGTESIPFSAIPSVIQNGLNANAPSGATPLDTTATDRVSVRSGNGITTYSIRFTATGTTTTVTVDSSGALTNLPSTTTTTFSAIPSEAQTELQTLATANGVATAIDPAASVKANDEANGTIVYSITLAAANTSGTGTHNITISVDQAGNPTVPLRGGFFGNFLYGGTWLGGGGGGGFGSLGFHSLSRRFGSFGF